METKIILTTTGMLLPESPDYYTPLLIEDVTNTSILNKNTATVKDHKLLEHMFTKVIYTSSIANSIYRSYVDNKSLDNYMAMVDFTANILYKLSIDHLLDLQVRNTNLSPFVFNLLVDMKYSNIDPIKYFSIPANLRFVLSPANTDQIITKRLELLKSKNVAPYVDNMENILSYVFSNKSTGELVFKTLFVDNY